MDREARPSWDPVKSGDRVDQTEKGLSSRLPSTKQTGWEGERDAAATDGEAGGAMRRGGGGIRPWDMW